VTGTHDKRYSIVGRILGAAIAAGLFAYAYGRLMLWSGLDIDGLFLLLVAIGMATRLWVRRIVDLLLAVTTGALLGGMWLETLTDMPCPSWLCLLVDALDSQWVVLLQVVVYVMMARLVLDGMVWAWRRWWTGASASRRQA
jgi:hypothetical protein